jgi:hypothetical protein
MLENDVRPFLVECSGCSQAKLPSVMFWHSILRAHAPKELANRPMGDGMMRPRCLLALWRAIHDPLTAAAILEARRSGKHPSAFWRRAAICGTEAVDKQEELLLCVCGTCRPEAEFY